MKSRSARLVRGPGGGDGGDVELLQAQELAQRVAMASMPGFDFFGQILGFLASPVRDRRCLDLIQSFLREL